MSSVNRFVHPLAPWIDPRSRQLILGSFPSPKSREHGMYYAHPQNRFWPVMEALSGQEIGKDAVSRREFILESGLALWDVVYEAELPDASDARMKVLQPTDLRPLLEQAPIERIYTTGRLATDLFARYQGPQLAMSSTYLPSTSAANRGHWPLEKLIESYRVVWEARA